MICKAYLVANSINLKAIPSELKLREACYIKMDENHYVIFPYGVIVCWGDGQLGNVLVLTTPHTEEPYPADKFLEDQFEVKIDKNLDKTQVLDDCFSMNEVNEDRIVALSHPIAQSLRLEQFESALNTSFEKVDHIPKNLAEFGKIFDKKKDIYKMQGHLYSLKVKMGFEHPVLDKPEYFWDNAEFDALYDRVAKYLEIQPRINVLEKKIGTIDGILSLLSEELNHRHSSVLEWIIILLILFEIVVFLVQEIIKII